MRQPDQMQLYMGISLGVLGIPWKHIPCKRRASRGLPRIPPFPPHRVRAPHKNKRKTAPGAHSGLCAGPTLESRSHGHSAGSWALSTLSAGLTQLHARGHGWWYSCTDLGNRCAKNIFDILVTWLCPMDRISDLAVSQTTNVLVEISCAHEHICNIGDLACVPTTDDLVGKSCDPCSYLPCVPNDQCPG